MLHRVHQMRAARQNTIEVIIICDALYTGCCAARQIPDRKLLPYSIYDMLTQISNDFQWSLYRVQCRQMLLRHGASDGVTQLSRRNKATSASDRRPSAPGVLSSAGKLIRYLWVLLLALSFRRRFPLLFFYPPSLYLSLSSVVH